MTKQLLTCLGLAFILPLVDCTTVEHGRRGGSIQKGDALALHLFGDEYLSTPNSTKEFYLYVKHEKVRSGIPLSPIRFFVYDVGRDSIVIERSLDNGTVSWFDKTRLYIVRIPGAITGDESPDAFTEVYDISAVGMQSR